MADECPRCLKPQALCICSGIQPVKARHRVVILQHPQEPDKLLGTARLATLALPNSLLKVGLSWPNLKSVLGTAEAQPSRWAVLYLGSGVKQGPGQPGPRPGTLTLVDKKGAPLPDSSSLLKDLEGIILLDGTWSQAKALWWRNPWLLKLRRAILAPPRKSLYGVLRKEPRRECVSTIETIAYTLAALGESKASVDSLVGLFDQLLVKYRERGKRREPSPKSEG
jgi:DTW domain-containing protein YfiP